MATQALSPLARSLSVALAMTTLAGSAAAVFNPTTACPPDSSGCEQVVSAPRVLRKMQPAVQLQHAAPSGSIFAQGSDLVVTSPRTTTTLGQTGDGGFTAFGQPSGTMPQVYVFQHDFDGDQCEVRVEGESIRVVRNGQPVDGRLVRREGQQVRVLNPDGQHYLTVRVPEAAVVQGQPLVERAIRVQPQQGGMAPAQPRRARLIETRPSEPAMERRVIRMNPSMVETAPAAQVRTIEVVPGGPLHERQVIVEAVPGQSGAWTVQNVPGAPARGTVRLRHAQPGVPAAPSSPQVQIERRSMGGAGGGPMVHIAPRAGGPGAGQLRAMNIPQPPAPPAPARGAQGGRGAGGPQVSGQIIIVGPDGQSRTIELGGQAAPGGVHTFTVPGGQGQFRVQTTPAAPGQGGGSCCVNCCGSGAGAMILDVDNVRQNFGGMAEVRAAQNMRPAGVAVPNLHAFSPLVSEVNLGDLGIDLGTIDFGHLGQLGGDIELVIQGALREAGIGSPTSLQVQVQPVEQTRAANAPSHARVHASPATVEYPMDVVVTASNQPSTTTSSGSGQRVRAAPQVEVRTQSGQTTATVQSQPRVAEVANQPRVMVGITMGEAPAEVLEGLGLEPGTAIRVEGVIDGLPASVAGLKAGAIIVGIDGSEYATPALLRQVLSGRQPGDRVTLDVLARGRRTPVELTLQAYDPAALQVRSAQVVEGMPSNVMTFDWSGQTDEMTARIREAIEAMTQSGVTRINEQELRARIDQIVRDQFARMEQGQHGMTNTLPRGALVTPGTPGQQGGMVFVQPTVPSAPTPPRAEWRQAGSDVEARLDQLSNRLDRLEERLARLAELMEQRRGARD